MTDSRGAFTLPLVRGIIRAYGATWTIIDKSRTILYSFQVRTAKQEQRESDIAKRGM